MTDYITFRSVTHAQRAEKLLRAAGINCILQRTPRWMEEKGCGYCLRVYPEDTSAARAALSAAGVRWRRIYGTAPDGVLREVPL